MPAAADEFTRVTAVTPAGAGRFTVDIDPGWTILGRPNGGYLLAVLGRAAIAAMDQPATQPPTQSHVVAASAHYLRSPEPGPAVVDVEVLRAGRSLSQVRVRLGQAGRACVEALITVGDLPAGPDQQWTGGVPDVAVAEPASCRRVPSTGPGGFAVAIMERVDLRLDPTCLGFVTGRPSGRGELAGWLALPGEVGFDSVSLLYAADALPPATFEIMASGWVPTLELTVYIRARPVPGPVRIVQRVQLMDAGRADEVCHVWDSAGRLVAQGSQLALVREPA